MYTIDLRSKIRNTLYLFGLIALLIRFSSAYADSLQDLFWAVRNDDLPTATRLLDLGLDPNSTNQDGYTVLMISAEHGYADLVQLLLKKHAATGRRNPAGDTALMLACLKGHLAVVNLLVEHGAAVNRRGWSPLAYAAFGGSAPVVRYLVAHGADINALAPNGYTPLMLAVRNGHSAAARELLYADADLAHRAPDGATALTLAEQGKDRALVKLLERAGARR